MFSKWLSLPGSSFCRLYVIQLIGISVLWLWGCGLDSVSFFFAMCRYRNASICMKLCRSSYLWEACGMAQSQCKTAVLEMKPLQWKQVAHVQKLLLVWSRAAALLNYSSSVEFRPLCKRTLTFCSPVQVVTFCFRVKLYPSVWFCFPSLRQ